MNNDSIPSVKHNQSYSPESSPTTARDKGNQMTFKT
jgi:hypothetical protein